MGTLYIIGTPIGNLADITYRAVTSLSQVDYILAEDTRVTTRLLRHYDIQTKLISWHEHSSERDWQRIKKYLLDGMSLALVTDAGTPGLSDPGGKLIESVLTETPEVKISPIPGPSALTAALSIAGINLHEFIFFGFLPHKKGRQTKLGFIKESVYPVVVYESVHRIEKLLTELATMGKQVILCRELTKKFETIYRGSAQEVLGVIPASELKGEFVVIIY